MFLNFFRLTLNTAVKEIYKFQLSYNSSLKNGLA